MPLRRLWTDNQVAMLTKLYPDTPTAEVATQLGIAAKRIYSKAARLGLKKSDAYLASQSACRIRVGGNNVGASSRFKKGGTPWNKGMKGLDIGGRLTRFQPGHRGGRAAELYQPIGAERLSKDGYLERKINDDPPPARRWRAVHLLVWESSNGKLPSGHAVMFVDGDKRNIKLDNLALVSRAELMRRNSYHQYGQEIAQLVQLRGAITRRINRKEKKT